MTTTGSKRPLFGYYGNIVQDLNEACNPAHNKSDPFGPNFDSSLYTSCPDERCLDEDDNVANGGLYENTPPLPSKDVSEVSSDDDMPAINQLSC